MFVQPEPESVRESTEPAPESQEDCRQEGTHTHTNTLIHVLAQIYPDPDLPN